jgi:outer membrane protein insertion porin family
MCGSGSSSPPIIEEDFVGDKIKLIEKYNENGFRDARILSDSISFNPNGTSTCI